jgi:hypothetical protein
VDVGFIIPTVLDMELFPWVKDDWVKDDPMKLDVPKGDGVAFGYWGVPPPVLLP